MTLPAKSYITPEEYLALEREAEHKSEYYNGEMFAMAGGSPEHDRITVNLTRELDQLLEDSSCVVFSGNMRVKVSPTGLYTYPDVSVACGGSQFEGKSRDTLLNPTLIIEVLSPSTEAYDRGEKFSMYQTLETLSVYLLISQDRPRVEMYTRKDGDTWIYQKVTGLDLNVEIPSLSCRLPMSRIYRMVDFSEGNSLHSTE